MLTQPLSRLQSSKTSSRHHLYSLHPDRSIWRSCFPSCREIGLFVCMHMHRNTETVALITCPTHQCKLTEREMVGGKKDPTGNSRCHTVTRSQISFRRYLLVHNHLDTIRLLQCTILSAQFINVVRLNASVNDFHLCVFLLVSRTGHLRIIVSQHLFDK